MAVRNVLDYQGQVIGQLELPDDTPEHIWQKKLEPYAVPPVNLNLEAIVASRIKKYQQLAPDLIIDLYVTNTLSGITTQQSDQMFDDYSDVLIRLREGAWPTALHRLEQKVPAGFVTQELINNWKQKILAKME